MGSVTFLRVSIAINCAFILLIYLFIFVITGKYGYEFSTGQYEHKNKASMLVHQSKFFLANLPCGKEVFYKEESV